MNISSNLKKIISFLLVTVLVMSAGVFQVSADTTKQVTYPAGTYPDDSYHSEYEYLGNCPVYTSDELVYTGEKSTDLMASFNLVQQYDMSFCKNSGFYMSRPFEYRSRWDYGKPAFINFGSADSAYNQMFTKVKFDSLTTDFVTENNIDMNTYDIYYMVFQDYHVTREYGYLYIDYICVPKNSRIAISNENKPEDSDNSSDIHYGLVLPANYKSVFYAETWINGETKAVNNTPTHFASKDFWNFLGNAHHSTIATNIPIFTLKADADMYVTTGKPLNDPSNKIPEETKKDEKIGADAFFWDSLKCRLTRVENKYKFIFDYSYSVSDMVAHPSEYMVNVDYTQTYKYKVVGKSNIVDDKYKTKSTALYLGNSPGSLVDDMNLFSPEACGVGEGFVLVCDEYIHILLGDNRDYTSVTFYNSYITVYVELVHVVDGGNGLSIKDKVSSDIRSFTFDALTLKSLDDTSDIEPVSEDKVEVKTEDTVDDDGNVTDRTVTGSTVINNITNTVNNYYYDSDGNKTDSSGSSIGDSLSDIASGLIKFIKTLVTEGLPAALEVLKTLIKSVSDLVSFAFDQVGDIGTGTSKGLIAVLKAIPTPLWGICSVGLIVFVIAGVLKKIF